ncbi:MAG TPA: amino acid synthesis family protein, partial [Burkholderiaceae bacterium]|nr:amino acid synthesis family protein [Burkholderiaceae bacterium]
MSTLVPRRWFRLVDDVHEPSDGGPMLRKAAVVAVVANPHANGNGGTDLQPLIDASAELGRRMAEVVREVMGPHGVESYGKGAIVGLSGEQEHANALLTTTFATPLR